VGTSKENYIAALPEFAQSFAEWKTPSLNLLLTDDFLCLESPRMAQGFARVLGDPGAIETERERQWWEPATSEGESAETTGRKTWTSLRKNGEKMPDFEGATRLPFTSSSVLLDASANGWLRGSTAWAGGQEADPRPKVIGHVDGFKGSTIANPGSPSIEFWELMRDFVQHGKMPQERHLGGIGYRRDFGAGGSIEVADDAGSSPPRSRL
jgi:hypothetical protein